MLMITNSCAKEGYGEGIVDKGWRVLNDVRIIWIIELFTYVDLSFPVEVLASSQTKIIMAPCDEKFMAWNISFCVQISLGCKPKIPRKDFSIERT